MLLIAARALSAYRVREVLDKAAAVSVVVCERARTRCGSLCTRSRVFGHAFPIVSTFGQLGAMVWMNPDRVVVAD